MQSTASASIAAVPSNVEQKENIDDSESIASDESEEMIGTY
jgi:hypothetical protein